MGAEGHVSVPYGHDLVPGHVEPSQCKLPHRGERPLDRMEEAGVCLGVDRMGEAGVCLGQERHGTLACQSTIVCSNI